MCSKRRALVATAFAAALAGAPGAGAAAPMVSKLTTVRAEATTIVVGTVSSGAKGPSIDVEYAIRGNPGKGPLAVEESPDGHVWVDRDPAKNRVVGFIDAKNRLRWVGRLVAGPSFERGVLRLEGFFDFNAHIVEPGVMTLDQLRSFLADGKLVQTYRATLAFRDGHGAIAPSSRSFTVEYDALARNTTVVGLTMACLDHGRLSSPAWGDFRLFFYCRDRHRTLHLSGEFTGVDTATGDILALAVPTDPFLDEAEFDRYIADPTATDVERRVEIVAGGKTWTWRVGAELVGPRGRVHAARGGSTGSRRSGGTTTTFETYRFDNKVSFTITRSGTRSGTHAGSRPAWMSNDAFIVQLADSGAYTRCRIAAGTQRARRCTLRHLVPVVKHGKAHAQPAATEAIAIQVAEQFIVDNGYTDQPPTKHLANVSRESLEPTAVSERLALRHDTLEVRAFGVTGSPKSGWFVVFRYKGKPHSPRGRAVFVEAHGRAVRVEHQDFVLARARKINATP